jgi:DNA-binding transcriptional LysR family regulator
MKNLREPTGSIVKGSIGLSCIRDNARTAATICYILIHMPGPLETAELLAFTKTVDAKSLSRAAADLGVPRATISRRLARLEGRLGARLLRRSTRSLVMTDAGEVFYRHARIVLDAVEQAEASVRRTDAAIRGELRVAVPPMQDAAFRAMLCDFAAQHPEVRLHVHFSSQLVDLHRGGYDVALRASSTFEPGLIVRTLRRAPLLALASPAYLAEHGNPRTLRELRGHRCLQGFARGEVPQTYWPTAGGGKLQVEGSFFSNEVQLLLDAALRGLGIALLPLMLTEPHILAGRLQHVLPGLLEAESQVALVFVEREFLPPQVRAFVDAVVAWSAQGLPKLEEKCERVVRERGQKARGKKRAKA